MSDKPSSRLPAVVAPKHYDLVYERVDLQNHTFQGHVSLQCQALQSLPTAVITLHAVELQITTATLQHVDTQATVPAHEFSFHQRNQTLQMTFDGALQQGADYVLKMEFHGILNDQMRGFYRSTFQGLDGQTHTMATTQFEATDARRAFPCMDEPALKATFTVTLTIPAHLECISNTPLAASLTAPDGKWKTLTFQKTPKMSTYLLAMIVGHFDAISETSRQIVTTVYTIPGKALQARFCLDLAVRCLNYYQDLFGVPYPLVKSDLLAIPE